MLLFESLSIMHHDFFPTYHFIMICLMDMKTNCEILLVRKIFITNNGTYKLNWNILKLTFTEF